MITVDHVTKAYHGRTAVEDLTFTLEKGHVYGFLGPNGAGKSTTMNLMTGVLMPDSGTVTVNGHDMLKEPEEAKRAIGYLPEIPPLYEDMTVDEYLGFVLELKGAKQGGEGPDLELLKTKTFLKDHGKRMIRHLSKGYRQRVGMAQALAGDPEIIILDEPTVGLDVQQITETRDLILSLKEGHIVVLSSHILSEIRAVCDEILIITRGRMVANGTMEELCAMLPDDGTVTVTVNGTEAEVLKALDNASLPVREVRVSGLEEVYLHLTKEAAE